MPQLSSLAVSQINEDIGGKQPYQKNNIRT